MAMARSPFTPGESVKSVEQEEVVAAQIEVPLGEVPEGVHITRRVSLMRLSRLEAENMRRLMQGLVARGERLRPTQAQNAEGNPGRPVTNTNDAVRWLLQNLYAED